MLGDAGSWGFLFANLPEEWWLTEKEIPRVKPSVFLVVYICLHFMVVMKCFYVVLLEDAGSSHPSRLSADTTGMCGTKPAGCGNC